MTVIACMVVCLLFSFSRGGYPCSQTLSQTISWLPYHDYIVYQQSAATQMKWPPLQFMSSYKPEVLLLQRRMCRTEKNYLFTLRCNFRWGVMRHQSQLLNYSSVTVMMTLWSWCIQNPLCSPFFFISARIRCWNVAVTPTPEIAGTCFTFISTHS